MQRPFPRVGASDVAAGECDLTLPKPWEPAYG